MRGPSSPSRTAQFLPMAVDWAKELGPHGNKEIIPRKRKIHPKQQYKGEVVTHVVNEYEVTRYEVLQPASKRCILLAAGGIIGC